MWLGGGHVMLKVQALFGTILDFHRCTVGVGVCSWYGDIG